MFARPKKVFAIDPGVIFGEVKLKEALRLSYSQIIGHISNDTYRRVRNRSVGC